MEKLTQLERYATMKAVQAVINAVSYDGETSEYSDNGGVNFLLSLSKEEYQALKRVYKKV